MTVCALKKESYSISEPLVTFKRQVDKHNLCKRRKRDKTRQEDVCMAAPCRHVGVCVYIVFRLAGCVGSGGGCSAALS